MTSSTLTFTAATAAQPGDVVTLYIAGAILESAVVPGVYFNCSDIPVTNETTGPSFYVSNTGNDSNPGTLALPWLTLGKAQTEVRALLPTQAADITVNVVNRLTVTTPLALTSDDSGQNGFKVVWKGGGTGSLDAGTRITGWTLWDAPKNIYRVAYTGANMRALWVNGERRKRARSYAGLPSGTADATGYTSTGGYLNGTRNVGNIEFVYDVYDFSEGRGIVTAAGASTITMLTPCHSYLANFWDTTLTNVENVYEDFYDKALAGTFYYDEAASFIYYIPRFGEDLSTAEVVAPNGLETIISAVGASDIDLMLTCQYTGLDLRPNGFASIAQGYYYDHDHGGDVPADATLSEYTVLPAAIYLAGCTRVNALGTVAQPVNVQRLSATAIHATLSCVECTIRGITFEDSSGNLVVIGEPSEGPLATCSTGIVVENNVIQYCGQEFQGSCSISAPYITGTLSKPSRIEHNYIWDSPYIGIAVGFSLNLQPTWQDKVGYIFVRYNDVANTMNVKHDGGGIYSQAKMNGLGGSGLTISDNWINDCGDGTHANVHASAGVYLDAGSAGVNVSDNVIMRGGWDFYFGLFIATTNYIIIGTNYTDGSGVDVDSNPPDTNTAPTVSTDPATGDGAAIVAASGLQSAYAGLINPTITAWDTLVSSLAPLNWWKNSEAGATSVDSGSRGYNGTRSGGYTASQAAIFAGTGHDSLLFDGTAKISTGTAGDIGDTPFSIVAILAPTYSTAAFNSWTILSTLSGTVTGVELAGFYNTAGGDYFEPLGRFSISASLWEANTQVASVPGSSRVLQSQPVLVVFTSDGSKNSKGLNLYVNNIIQCDSRPRTGTNSGTVAGTTPIQMGARTGSSPDANGKYGDAIVLPFELTQEQVEQLYLSAVTTP